MDSLLADLRYAGRALLKRPGFTIVALLIMAFGIGANSAIFSIVNAVLLRPLPVERPEQLVEIYSQEGGEIPATQAYPDYLDIRGHDDVYSDVIAYSGNFFAVSEGARTEIVLGESVSGNYFEMLGVKPQRGRLFIEEEDDVPGAAPTVVISHAMWERRFGSDPNIVGRTLTLKGRPFDVIGVTPPEFSGLFVGLQPTLWVPLGTERYLNPGSTALEDREGRWLFVKGRLREGVSFERTSAAMEVLAQQLADAHPESNSDRKFVLARTSDVRLHPMIDRALVPVGALLMVVVGLVLLIACANLANLLIARALGRRKEVAIRLALGAKRGRLVRQLLTESMALALAGGALGVLLAYLSVGALVSFRPPTPVTLSLDLGIDMRVLAYTASLSLATGLLFGLAPALQATKPDVARELKGEVASLGGGYRGLGLRNLLVTTQVAVSLVLLIGAGLFVRSLMSAHRVDPGFEDQRAAIASLAVDLSDYDEGQGRQFYRRLVDRLRALPDVEAAAITSRVPLGMMIRTTDLFVEGLEFDPDDPPEIDIATVGPGYFETMRIPLLRGRGFSEQDRDSTAQVAIVSEAAARRYWPGANPIGATIRVGGADRPARKVIGVARDTKVRTLGERPRPYLYLPFQQDYEPAMSVIARVRGEPAAALPALRREIAALDPDLPIMELKTMREHLGIMLFAPRMGGVLLAIFGAFAALLAATGLYGVVAYAAGQRTREVGIRVALGARPADVVGLVVRQGLVLVGIGAGIGLSVAALASRPLSPFLYGIEPWDPVTFIGVTALLALAAVVASLVPALRAARLDPLAALRHEG